ncbi:hypothetical protein E2C01_026506 [Portunus trituberculatus]|uniref:Uncharacterized protein n=1 Tax=Portunus trituberculatus TaxID=210409 RepID=A0A5B7EJD7_PORTR|nr:hypothetical protein [Portunus trituberculatus]
MPSSPSSAWPLSSGFMDSVLSRNSFRAPSDSSILQNVKPRDLTHALSENGYSRMTAHTGWGTIASMSSSRPYTS